jgi:hypothetical protein
VGGAATWAGASSYEKGEGSGKFRETCVLSRISARARLRHTRLQQWELGDLHHERILAIPNDIRFELIEKRIASDEDVDYSSLPYIKISFADPRLKYAHRAIHVDSHLKRTIPWIGTPIGATWVGADLGSGLLDHLNKDRAVCNPGLLRQTHRIRVDSLARCWTIMLYDWTPLTPERLTMYRALARHLLEAALPNVA